jgi:hypothetical protein
MPKEDLRLQRRNGCIKDIKYSKDLDDPDLTSENN